MTKPKKQKHVERVEGWAVNTEIGFIKTHDTHLIPLFFANKREASGFKKFGKPVRVRITIEEL